MSAMSLDASSSSSHLGKRKAEPFWGRAPKKVHQEEKSEGEQKSDEPVSVFESRELLIEHKVKTFQISVAQLSVFERYINITQTEKLFGREFVLNLEFRQSVHDTTLAVHDRWRAIGTWMVASYESWDAVNFVVQLTLTGKDPLPIPRHLVSSNAGMAFKRETLDGFVLGDQLSIDLHVWKRSEVVGPGRTVRVDQQMWERCKDGTVGDLKIEASDGSIFLPSFLMETLFPFFRVRANSPVGSSSVQHMTEEDASKDYLLAIVETNITQSPIKRPDWSLSDWKAFIHVAQRWLVADRDSELTHLPAMDHAWNAMDQAILAKLKTFRDEADAEDLLDEYPKLVLVAAELKKRRDAR